MRSLRILVAVAAASGCGNSGGGGAGPAPVATVTVTPPNATLSVGDTLRLVAMALDGSGAVVSGHPVTWSSGAPAVVTVSASGTVTAIAAGSATVTATVDGRSGTTRITSNPPVPKIVLDATGTSASVGFAGAIITATASSGLVYQLTIPEGALDVATQITMTPIKSFTGLPLSGGFVGGLDFQPSGLQFHSPATLVIQTAPNIPSGQRLVGLRFSSTGDSLRLEPATVAGGTTTMLISHFSGAGVALGTVLDLSSIPLPPNSAAQDTALASLSGLSLPGDQAAILAALRRWQQAIVLRLQLATTDVLVRDGRAEFAAWFAELALYPGPEGATLRGLLSPELATLRLVLAAAYRVGITFANQQCVAQRSLVAARNALILQSSAQTDSVATVGNSLDRPTVLTNLCVRLVLIDSTYVPTPGQSTPLSARFGFRFGADSTTAFDRFGFLFDIHGTTSDRALRDTTDAVGRYTLSLTPSAALPNVRVDVNACLVPLALPDGDVCLALTIDPIFFKPISLPNGTVGDEYSQTLVASGGTGSYLFNFRSGTLPPGVFQTGSIISGTLLTAGSFSFNIRVTSGSQFADRSFGIDVANGTPQPPPPLPPPSGTCPDISVGHGSRDTPPNSDSLKTIACIDNLLVLNGNTDTTAVTFGGLTKVEEALAVEFSGGPIKFPVLSFAGPTVFQSSPGEATLDLSSLQKVWGLAITNNPNLTSITLGTPTINGDLEISGNSLLTTLTMACGTLIRGKLTITGNPGLASAQLQVLVNCLTVTGTKSVSNNGP